MLPLSVHILAKDISPHFGKDISPHFGKDISPHFGKVFRLSSTPNVLEQVGAAWRAG